jgi:omega-6 fatty acid desaturase (delta-12 desaturase)
MKDTNAAKKYTGWQKLVRQYQQPDIKKSSAQLINSIGGLLITWTLMYFSMRVGYWLTLLLSIPAAGFVIRIFIIQHDCGHGSFFKSRKANTWIGSICGVLTFTPYSAWRKSHAIHHAHHAELEERGIGDVWTLTVEEYNASPRSRRFFYRVFRNPLFLFVLTPAINFIILHRLPIKIDERWRNGEKASIHWTNAAIVLALVGLGLWLGFLEVIAIQLPIISIAAAVGTWLFYVQHQFEKTYWEHTPEWNYTLAAMHGSSYYKLPRILQWFTGNIGFHHIHHLSPRIPNYNLEACHTENPMFQQVVQLTLWQSFKTTSLSLWDEGRQRLVTFREAKQLRPASM